MKPTLVYRPTTKLARTPRPDDRVILARGGESNTASRNADSAASPKADTIPAVEGDPASLLAHKRKVKAEQMKRWRAKRKAKP